MTAEVIAHPALQLLDMATTQRPARRRSARAAEDETHEDAPPAKRARMDDANGDKGVGGSGATGSSVAGQKAAAKKRGKNAFKEDDGFTFSRPKSKKTAAAEPTTTKQQEDPPVLEKPPTDAQSGVEPEKSRRKKTSLEAQPQDDRPKRRSARLSGEKPAQPPLELSLQSDLSKRPVTQKKQPQQQQPKQREERDGSPGAPAPTELRVEKKRGKDKDASATPTKQSQSNEEPNTSLRTTKIALPFQDTPVIARNREMRQSSGQSVRRSSGSLRGRRASSLIESGTSNALPHNEVRIEDFYKHIGPDLLETRRMKQLLMWCATRAMPDRPTGTSGDVNAILAARTIEEELLNDFSNKAEMSDWFDRVESAPEILVKKPNPRNQQNAARLKELQEQKKRLEGEKAAWAELLSSFSQTQQDTKATTQMLNEHRPTEASLLDKAQSELLQTAETHATMVGDARSRLAQATDSLEFRIDSLGDGVHKLEKFREVLDETVDQVQARAGEALDSKEETALQRAGTEKVGVHDLLRGLSRAAQR